jgi:hypothetical protein
MSVRNPWAPGAHGWQDPTVGTEQRTWVDPALWSVRTGLTVVVAGCLVLGVGGSQVILWFARDPDPGPLRFLVFWALLILVIDLWLLLAIRIGFGLSRGAAITPARPGESQAEAEARADKLGWRANLALFAVASMLFYAFIVWQAIEEF